MTHLQVHRRLNKACNKECRCKYNVCLALLEVEFDKKVSYTGNCLRILGDLTETCTAPLIDDYCKQGVYQRTRIDQCSLIAIQWKEWGGCKSNKVFVTCWGQRLPFLCSCSFSYLGFIFWLCMGGGTLYSILETCFFYICFSDHGDRGCTIVIFSKSPHYHFIFKVVYLCAQSFPRHFFYW